MAATIIQEEKNAVDDIIITNHAIERFLARAQYMKGGIPTDPASTIRKLLAKSVPEEVDPVHRVKRLIKHGFTECTYLLNSGWRFVVCEGVLVTVERSKGRN